MEDIQAPLEEEMAGRSVNPSPPPQMALIKPRLTTDTPQGGTLPVIVTGTSNRLDHPQPDVFFSLILGSPTPTFIFRVCSLLLSLAPRISG